MDFSVPDETRALIARVRRIVDDEVLPLEPDFLSRPFSELEPRLEELRAAVKDEGLWAPQVPRELGGMGLGVLEHGLVSEVLGRTPLGHYVFGCQAPDAGNVEVLHAYASPEMRERWLEPLVAGEIRSCFAMTEPDTPGSDPTQLACRAVRDGDDYVIDGRKWFATGADGAAFAIVMAVTDPEAPPHRRASQILVPTDTDGYELVRNTRVMGHVGEGWASHGEVRFSGCRVPVAHRLGDEGAGFRIAQERLGPGRIHHCMRWIGICERAFDLLCERALGRELRGSRLADKQIVQAWIAESRARIDAARLAVLQAAWQIDRDGFGAARTEISLIKFHVAAVMLEVVDRGLQVYGAAGLTDESVLSFFYAAERGARIYDGPDEVHKLAAARRILKRYADA